MICFSTVVQCWRSCTNRKQHLAAMFRKLILVPKERKKKAVKGIIQTMPGDMRRDAPFKINVKMKLSKKSVCGCLVFEFPEASPLEQWGSGAVRCYENSRMMNVSLLIQKRWFALDFSTGHWSGRSHVNCGVAWLESVVISRVQTYTYLSIGDVRSHVSRVAVGNEQSPVLVSDRLVGD